ncbi:SDR family NAD(P)-dependent oxidoreductase [Thorsellia kenyensis]|uniref:SDR family NAD(P)-dependent oxidoreductase n=1 Tax=Thorsellia kenyensis TaxID=1549888 RepID=A0ABV6CBI6_9GAMM
MSLPYPNKEIEHLAIVTGASKGLGYSMTKVLLSENVFVVTIARSDNILDENDLLTEKNTHHFSADLSCTESTTSLLEKLTNFIDGLDALKSITLINNAGTVAPMGLFDSTLNDYTFSEAFELNVVSAMRLCKWLIERKDISDENKKILNISSGAGRKGVPGWGVYCATKAALDRFSEVIALERPKILVSSLAPGVIDTQMQQTIRATPKENFPTLDRFTELHASGNLSHPDKTAKKIINFLANKDFGATVIDDIRLHDV